MQPSVTDPRRPTPQHHNSALQASADGAGTQEPAPLLRRRSPRAGGGFYPPPPAAFHLPPHRSGLRESRAEPAKAGGGRGAGRPARPAPSSGGRRGAVTPEGSGGGADTDTHTHTHTDASQRLGAVSIVLFSQSPVAENTRLKNYTKELVLLNHLITKINGMEENKVKTWTKIHILRSEMLQQNAREAQLSCWNAAAAPRCPPH